MHRAQDGSCQAEARKVAVPPSGSESVTHFQTPQCSAASALHKLSRCSRARVSCDTAFQSAGAGAEQWDRLPAGDDRCLCCTRPAGTAWRGGPKLAAQVKWALSGKVMMKAGQDRWRDQGTRQNQNHLPTSRQNAVLPGSAKACRRR